MCLDWKFTLDHCPRYWATILAVARDERVWDIILPLAKAVPLKISTAFTVPLERQSLVLARVRVAHIDRDDATTSWDSVLSSFEDLPLLDALHLTRPYSHRRNKKPLTIRASRLWMLCLDRPASIQAVSLTSLRITRFRYDILQCLLDLFDTSTKLRELAIDDPSCTTRDLWTCFFPFVARLPLESLFIRLDRWYMCNTPSSAVIPSLQSLHVEVPTPVASSSLQHIFANLSNSHLFETLRCNPTVRTLVIVCYKMSNTPPTPGRIHLPLCTKIDILTSLSYRVLNVLASIDIPRLQDLSLRLYVGVTGSQDLPPGLCRPLAHPFCHLRQVSHDDIQRSAHILPMLATFMRRSTFGAVSVSIHVDFLPLASQFLVTFSAKDSFIRKTSSRGLCLLIYIDKPSRSERGHKHVDKLSVAFALRAFAWDAVDELAVSYNSSGSWPQESTVLYPDPLSTVLSDDTAHLELSMAHMSGLRSLTIMVTYGMFIDGLPILQRLGSRTGAILWPQLTYIHLLADKNIANGFPARAQMWHDLHNFLRARLSVASGPSESCIRLTLQGAFCVCNDDILVKDDILRLADVVEVLDGE